MQDLIRRMAEVANELDELGLNEQASKVDSTARELTSQIGDGLGWDVAPGGGTDEIGGDVGGGEDEGVDDADLDEKVRALLLQQTQQLGDPATWTKEQKLQFLQQGTAAGGTDRQQAIAPNTSAVPAA